MPAYGREGSGWTEAGVLRGRTAGGEWTDVADNGYVWDGSAWVQFQPNASSDLLPPQSLVVLPSDTSASATWTNPTQDPGNDPTHVQVRIPETTTVWTEIAMDVTATSFGFLAPETAYQMQIRYIIREDGAITKTSPITEAFFTTDALTGPGTPAADPGGTGSDSTIPWGIPDGAGPVGGPGCWWEYIVQTATTPASGAIVWADTAVTGSFDGDAGSLNIDFVAEGLSCGALARMKYRENCDGVTGDYEFGDAFVMVCDWDADCGGVPASPQFDSAVYADAIIAAPELCETAIVDSNDPTIEWAKLPGFGSIQTIDNHTVFGLTTNGTLGQPTLAAKYGAIALLTDGDDFSFNIDIQLEEVPGGASGGSGVAPASFPVIRFGKNLALSVVFDTTTTYVVRMSWIASDGTFKSVTGTTPVGLDTYATVTATLDADGNKTLYLNGVQEAQSTDTTSPGFSDYSIGQDVEVYTNEFMRFESIGAWDRVLTASEINTLSLEYEWPYRVETPVVTEMTNGVDTLTASLSTARTGDLRLLFVGVSRNNNADETALDTPPTGWTLIDRHRSGVLYYRFVQNGDAGTVDLDWSAGTVTANDGYAYCETWRNCDTTNPYLMANVAHNGANNSTTFSTQSNPAPYTRPSPFDNGFEKWTSYYENCSYNAHNYAEDDWTWQSTTGISPFRQSAAILTTEVIQQNVGTSVNYTIDSGRYEGVLEGAEMIPEAIFRMSGTVSRGWQFDIFFRAPRTEAWLATPHVVMGGSRYEGGGDLLINDCGFVAPEDPIFLFFSSYAGTTESFINYPTELDGMVGWCEWADLGTWNWPVSDRYMAQFQIANVNTLDPIGKLHGNGLKTTFGNDEFKEDYWANVSNVNQRVLRVHINRDSSATFEDSMEANAANSNFPDAWTGPIFSETQVAGAGDSNISWFDLGNPASTGLLEVPGYTATGGSTVGGTLILPLNPPGVTTPARSTPSIRAIGTVTGIDVVSPSWASVPIPAHTAGDLLLCFNHRVVNGSSDWNTAGWMPVMTLGNAADIDFYIMGKIGDGTTGNIEVRSDNTGLGGFSVVVAFQNCAGVSAWEDNGNNNTTLDPSNGGNHPTPTHPNDNVMILRAGTAFNNLISDLAISAGTEIMQGFRNLFTDAYFSLTAEARTTAGAFPSATVTITPDSTPETYYYANGELLGL